jgi:hypothetical protein
MANTIESDEERALAHRTKLRLAGRSSFDLNLGFAFFKHQSYINMPFPLARVLVGYRKHSEPDLGFQLRGGALVGLPWAQNPTDRGTDSKAPDSVTTWMLGGTVEAATIFVPAGRFYVSPAVSLDYVKFRETTLHMVDATVHLSEGLSIGLGFDVGGTLGTLEQTNVYQSFRLTFGSGESMFLLLFGIGYLR